MIFGKLYKIKTKTGDTITGTFVSKEDIFKSYANNSMIQMIKKLKQDGYFIIHVGSKKLTFLDKKEMKKAKMIDFI